MRVRVPHERHYLSVITLNAPRSSRATILALHDALPISEQQHMVGIRADGAVGAGDGDVGSADAQRLCPRRHLRPRRLHPRSEEHTSELQSRFELVCRPLLAVKTATLRIIAQATDDIKPP